MSSYTEVYIEYKEKQEKNWHLFCIDKNCDFSCINEDLKYDIEKLSVYGDVDLESIANVEDTKRLSPEFRMLFKHLDEDYHCIQYIDLKYLSALLDKITSNYITELKSIYTALGCYLITDMYEDVPEDDKYDDDGNVKSTYNPLTFPINKELLENNNKNFVAYEVAHRLSAIIDMVFNMLNRNNFDFDAPTYEARLILIKT